jgi:hypothetical protein
MTECERILKEEADAESEESLLSFKDLLSWKMPEHLISNMSKSYN